MQPPLPDGVNVVGLLGTASGPRPPLPVKGASAATPAEKAATMYGYNRAARRKTAKEQRRKQAKVA